MKSGRKSQDSEECYKHWSQPNTGPELTAADLSEEG